MDKCGQIVDKRLRFRFCQNSHLGVPTSQTWEYRHRSCNF